MKEIEFKNIKEKFTFLIMPITICSWAIGWQIGNGLMGKEVNLTLVFVSVIVNVVASYFYFRS